MTDEPRPEVAADAAEVDAGQEPDADPQALASDDLASEPDEAAPAAFAVEPAVTVEPDPPEPAQLEPAPEVEQAGPAEFEPAPESAPATARGHGRLRWAAAILIGLLAAAVLGFGAAVLVVPRLANVSTPIATLGPSPTPSPIPTASPSSSPTASATPSSTPKATATPRGTSTTYVVKRGDILSAIAARFGVSVQAIVAANDLADANHIIVGQRLVIPAPTPSP